MKTAFKFIVLFLVFQQACGCYEPIAVSEKYLLLSDEKEGWLQGATITSDPSVMGVEDFFLDFVATHYGDRGTSAGSPYRIKIGASAVHAEGVEIERLIFYNGKDKKQFLTLNVNMAFERSSSPTWKILDDKLEIDADVFLEVIFLKREGSEYEQLVRESIVFKYNIFYREKVIDMPLFST